MKRFDLYVYEYLQACVCAACVLLVPEAARVVCQILGATGTDSCGFWELNLGSLQKYHVMLSHFSSNQISSCCEIANEIFYVYLTALLMSFIDLSLTLEVTPIMIPRESKVL